jgi:hypothetical protein
MMLWQHPAFPYVLSAKSPSSLIEFVPIAAHIKAKKSSKLKDKRSSG